MTKLRWQWRLAIGVLLFEFSVILILKLTSIQSPVGIEIFSETLPLSPLIWKVWIFISFDWITVYFCLRLNISFVIVRAMSAANGWCMCRSTDLIWSVDLVFPDKIGCFWGRFGMASHSSGSPTCVSAKVHWPSPLLEGWDSGGTSRMSSMR